MLPSQAITIIEDRVGNRTGLSTRIINEMQLAQRTELERAATLPWFLLSLGSVATVVGTGSASVPTGFLREHSEGGVFCTDADGKYQRLAKGDYADLSVDDWEDGRPTDYALVGSVLYLFPTPDADYGLKLLGYYQGTLPTAGDATETAWMANAPDLMIAAAGRRLARYLRDKDAVELFELDFREAMKRLVIDNIAREQGAFEQVMGG